MHRSAPTLALLLILTSCHAPGAADGSAHGPIPGHYGRPAVVRAFGRAGTWIGAVPGAVLSLVAYPFTWTLNELVDEPLGMNRQEWTVAPLTGMAAVGNQALGAPVDGLHWLFWRAWVGEEEVRGFDHVPAEESGK